jgi:hypothetical protein
MFNFDAERHWALGAHETMSRLRRCAVAGWRWRSRGGRDVLRIMALIA